MNLKYYWVTVSIVAVVLAFLTNITAKWLIAPADDGNLSAYKVLVVGIQSGRYDTMVDCASVACQQANDETLLKIADYLGRVSDLAIRSGVRTFQEANSFSGFVKFFIAGFLDPLKGIESTAIMIESWWNKKDFEKVDTDYFSLWQKEFFADKVAFWIAVFVFPVVLIVAYKQRGQITNWVNSRERPNNTQEMAR